MRMLFAALLAATLTPAVAQAQTRELRDDRRDIVQERRELRDARRHGDYRDVREERRDVREARQEYREDWRDWRRDNPRAFRRPAYAAPVRGWAYRPVYAGHRLPPAYWSPAYVIADPWRYRLPRAAGFTRWVRYGRDVLLIDTRGGIVRQAYRGFFY